MKNDPERILAELQDSLFTASKLPKRPLYSIEAWERLCKEERRSLDKAAGNAMEYARSMYRRWEESVRTLGTLRYLPAVPLLSDIWRDCALVPVRVSAGHALLAIGTPAAYDALAALIDDWEDVSVHLGVRALFRRDPLAAFDRLAPLFQRLDITSATIGYETLSILAPAMFSPNGTAHWAEDEVPFWLEQDLRWLALCAELVQDERHGETARTVLRHASRDSVLSALDAARVKRAPRPAPVTRAAGDLLARYRAGDHLGVWHQARVCAAIDSDLRAEIAALAEETMSRVAYNVELISERLLREGWRTLGPMRTVPEQADAERIAAIEQMTGAPLPPSLAAFWRLVGGVSWVWDYEADSAPMIGGLPLAHIDTDALFIGSCASMEPLCFEAWRDQKAVIHPDLVGPFELELSPDRLHKMNVSGGPPYTIGLPFRGADPLFRQEDRSLSFVDYLRDCLGWSGFPHLKYHADQAAVDQFINYLGRGLEPF